MKIILVFCVFISVTSLSKVQSTSLSLNAGLTHSFINFPPSQFFQDVILQSEAQKLLTTTNFPDDLRQRIVDVMSNAEAGFNDCNAAAISTMPWMQMRCITLQLRNTKNALKAIKEEAKERATAGVATAAPTSSLLTLVPAIPV